MKQTTALTREQAEDRALADYDRHAGRLVRVRSVYAYGPGDDGDDYDFPDGLLVRVDRHQDEGSLLHWSDRHWLDPYWDVTPVELPPELAGTRSWWTYAPSYNVKTGEVDAGGITLVPEPEVAVRIRGLVEDARNAWHRWRSRRRRRCTST